MNCWMRRLRLRSRIPRAARSLFAPVDLAAQCAQGCLGGELSLARNLGPCRHRGLIFHPARFAYRRQGGGCVYKMITKQARKGRETGGMKRNRVNGVRGRGIAGNQFIYRKNKGFWGGAGGGT